MKDHKTGFLLSCRVSVKTKTYTVQLHNKSDKSLDSFNLCFSIPTTTLQNITNAIKGYSLSTYVEFSMPKAELKPQDSWSFSFTSETCAHRSDAPAAAFLVLNPNSPAERIESVDTEITMCDAKEEEIRKFKECITIAPLAKVSYKNYHLAPVPFPNKFNLIYGSVDLSKGLCLKTSNMIQDYVYKFYTQMQELKLYKNIKLFNPDSNLALYIELIDRTAELEETSAVTLAESSEKISAENEHYTLEISEKLLRIQAKSRAAVLRALASLIQLVEKHTKAIPCCFIEDSPRFAWRGCMLDTVRQFYSVEEIQTILRILALHKMNVFHWHLTDDEAWRVELDSFPELHDFAYRGYKQALAPFCASGHGRYGGMYSKKDIQEIHRCAEELQISIVPEFDLPAHCYSLKQALPQLNEHIEDQNTNLKERNYYESIQGFPNNVLNPALPATYEVIEKIICELCSQFSNPYFHIGCDERPRNVWSKSPAAIQLAQDLQLSNTEALMAHFVKKVQKIVEAENKICCAWEEAHSYMDAGVLFSWTSDEVGIKAASLGQKVVFCPAQYYYLDMAQSPYPEDYGASWAGYSHVKQSYLYEAVASHASYEKSVLGIQANIWSENFHDKSRLAELLFPRLLAISESAWTLTEHKDYIRFNWQLEHHKVIIERLRQAMNP